MNSIIFVHEQNIYDRMKCIDEKENYVEIYIVL